MFDQLSKMLEKPSLYKKSEVVFWDDAHISQQMLRNHLDPNFEGASRTLNFINQSVAWIEAVMPPFSGAFLLMLVVVLVFMQKSFVIWAIR